MILFELRCSNDHQFEAWFRDGATYDAQVNAGEIACPVCGDCKVEKAIMAPRLAKRTGAALDVQAVAAEMRKSLRELRRTVEEKCTYVGDRFADEARRIHYGETEARSIYGEATDEQSRELEEEGVTVQRIPWVGGDN
jgi:hypothetical protein